MARLPWRRWVRVIHRDMGYLCAGLTVVYAVSGVAVNHVADWNPSYEVEQEEFRVAAVEPGVLEADQVASILSRLPHASGVEKTFQPDPGTLKVLTGGTTWTVELASGRVVKETVRGRPVRYESNGLNLNQIGRAAGRETG